MPKPPTRDRIHILLQREIYTDLKLIAVRQGRPVQDVHAEAVAEYVKRNSSPSAARHNGKRGRLDALSGQS